jgi:hypothetical protein
VRKENLQYVAGLLVFLSLLFVAEVRSMLKYRAQYVKYAADFTDLVSRSNVNVNRHLVDLSARGAAVRAGDEGADYVKIMEADVDTYSGILRELDLVKAPPDLWKEHSRLEEIFRAQSSVEVMLIHYLKTGDRKLFDEAERLFGPYKEAQVVIK